MKVTQRIIITLEDATKVVEDSKKHMYHQGAIDYKVDVLWGQPIKLIQIFSASEFHEYVLME